MFGLPTKEEARQLDNSILKEVIDKWKEEALDALNLIEDPVKKLSVLKEYTNAVNAEITEKENKILKTAKKNGDIVNVVSLGTAAFAGIIFITSGGSLLIPTILTIASIVSLAHIAPRITASTEKRLNLENSEFMDSLKNLKKVFSNIEREIMGENRTKISNTVVDSKNKPSSNSSLSSTFIESVKNDYNNITGRTLASNELFKMSTEAAPSPSI